MSTFTQTHNACFRAELLKLRRTALPWLCIGAALFIPLIQTLANIFLSDGHQENAWPNFLQWSVKGFTGFFYQLFLILLIGRIVYLEHRYDTWKLLETQPVSRPALFLVKFEVAALVAALCLLLLVGFSLLGGALLQVAKPELGFAKSGIEWGVLFGAVGRIWIASLGLLALQYYLALLLRNFAAPMSIGLIGIIAAGILNDFGLLTWLPYNAIALSQAAYKGSPTGSGLLYHEWLSGLWCVFFLLMAYQLQRQRGFVPAHLRGRRGIVTGLSVVLLAALVVQVSKPRVMGRSENTVIAGRIKAEQPVQSVALVRPAFSDTIATAPATGGRFRLLLPDTLPPGFYRLHAGAQKLDIYFGSKDSLSVDLQASKDEFKLVFGGTRAAESEFLQTTDSRPDFSRIRRFQAEALPDAFMRELQELIAGQEKEAERFHTTDNVRLAPDFLASYRKLLEVGALYELEVEYPKSFMLYHPNKELKFGPEAERLRRSVSFADASLIDLPGFLDFATRYIGAKTARSANRDSAFSAFAAQQVPSLPLREAIHLRFARERLARTNDTASRQQVVQAAFAAIQNPVYQRHLQGDLVRLNSMLRGRPAPDFKASAASGTTFSLENFRGRYVVIDVWATWCGPCKRESPAFEDLSERYTDERLLFAAISIDEDKKAWQREVMFKSERVLQLHVEGDAFAQAYGISSIPRFLLIGPDGRIVNANLPPPSEPEFLAILQREVYNMGSN
ncbi:ABC transporter permease [Flaviaesturariibacter amylovorans]|uniref:Thioredoxin domain-containing protein n=1 Tax=Flaviaesturariibacter amylovorans TaxID=1084520 RepID=A0ABP8HR22_9BACT